MCIYVDLQLPMQSVPITTKVVSSNPAHGEMYSVQHYVIKFVSNRSVVFSWYSVSSTNKTDGQIQVEKWVFAKIFWPVSQWVQINFMFTDIIHLLCLSWNFRGPKPLPNSERRRNKHQSYHFQRCSLSRLC
jgi:hypothetical protein